MKDRIGAKDQISFRLNGKPFQPGQQPQKENVDEVNQSNSNGVAAGGNTSDRQPGSSQSK